MPLKIILCYITTPQGLLFHAVGFEVDHRHFQFNENLFNYSVLDYHGVTSKTFAKSQSVLKYQYIHTTPKSTFQQAGM